MKRRKNDDVVLLGEVASALGISRMTAYIRARAGEIPALWRGGRYEMTRADLNRLIQAGGETSHSE